MVVTAFSPCRSAFRVAESEHSMGNRALDWAYLQREDP
jgi:hypothetical protein